MLVLSPRVQRLLTVLAPEEAYSFGSKVLDIEHLLLALLKSADGLGYITLKAMKINVLMLQTTIEQSLPPRSLGLELTEIPHSNRLRNMLDSAAVEARILRCDYVGTEHLLLSALREFRDSEFFHQGTDFAGSGASVCGGGGEEGSLISKACLIDGAGFFGQQTVCGRFYAKKRKKSGGRNPSAVLP